MGCARPIGFTRFYKQPTPLNRGAHHNAASQAHKDAKHEIDAHIWRRRQEKAIRHAHEALRGLRDGGQFDEARAGAAPRELGQAIAAEALLEARLQAQVLAVLTPEQRGQLRQRGPQAPSFRE